MAVVLGGLRSGFLVAQFLLFEFVAADFFEVVDDEDERCVDDLGDEFEDSASPPLLAPQPRPASRLEEGLFS